jgi:hypothetical protein
VCPGTMWNDKDVIRTTPPLRRTATGAEVPAVRDGGFNVYTHPERIDVEG